MTGAKKFLFLIGLFLFFSAPASSSPENSDPHSFSRPAEVVLHNIDLDLTLDFVKKEIEGNATLKFERLNRAAKQLFLDSRDLKIERVSTLPDKKPARFKLGQSVQHLGQSLIIDLSEGASAVEIRYRTSPSGAALQWIPAHQTAGAKQPFFFTQSQAAMARTWFPCQDSPSVRTTYSARVKVPPTLMALMSATNPTKRSADGVYHFRMNQAVPSYLFALAVGDLQFKPTGKRTGVYAEARVIEKAAWEFAETEEMMLAAEKLYGPYRWDRYDLLILPSSFPYGGMENPRLTFLNTIMITGDRSLASIVAHELSHSWSGNLVTNSSWNDFWLNEGFTTYIDHRITEVLWGKEYSDMSWAVSMQNLKDVVRELGPNHPLTRLHLDMKGLDPEDGVTDLAYTKGAYFLKTLEEIVGRQELDAFLRFYFDRFAFQSMSAQRFGEFLQTNLLSKHRDAAKTFQLDAWLNDTGIPNNIAPVNPGAFDSVTVPMKAWLAGKIPASDIPWAEWKTIQRGYFLLAMPKDLTTRQIADLDSAFHISRSTNSYILSLWFPHVIDHQYKAAYGALDTYLTSMGRRRYLKPLYEKLAATPDGLELAQKIFARARLNYHPISIMVVERILASKTR